VQTPSRIALRWQSVSNRNYAVRKATNLAEGFLEIVAGNLDADPPMNVFTSSVENASDALASHRLPTGRVGKEC